MYILTRLVVVSAIGGARLLQIAMRIARRVLVIVAWHIVSVEHDETG